LEKEKADEGEECGQSLVCGPLESSTFVFVLNGESGAPKNMGKARIVEKQLVTESRTWKSCNSRQEVLRGEFCLAE
jgi:hypothetical protein